MQEGILTTLFLVVKMKSDVTANSTYTNFFVFYT